MKSLLVKLGVILIGLAVLGYGEVWGADYKFFGGSESYKGYYDVQSITRTSQNIVRVWTRWNFTEKGITECVKYLGKEYENVSYLLLLEEINCAEKKMRLLSVSYYDNNGATITSNYSPQEERFINPDSLNESLYKVVCK
jgi:hypothetical protein